MKRCEVEEKNLICSSNPQKTILTPTTPTTIIDVAKTFRKQILPSPLFYLITQTFKRIHLMWKKTLYQMNGISFGHLQVISDTFWLYWIYMYPKISLKNLTILIWVILYSISEGSFQLFHFQKSLQKSQPDKQN